MHPAAIILDMDGLMVDSEPLWGSVERAMAARRGGRWTDEMARRCLGTGLPATVRTMAALLDLEIDVVAGVQELVAGFLERVGELELKPGCRELLDAAGAASIPLALASSSTRALVEAVLTRFALAPRFAVVLSGDAVAQPKPAPDLFTEASRRLGIEPAGCVVLEDSLAGVQAAIAAGIPVIAVPEAEPEPFRALTPRVARDLYEAAAMLSLENTRRQHG